MEFIAVAMRLRERKHVADTEREVFFEDVELEGLAVIHESAESCLFEFVQSGARAEFGRQTGRTEVSRVITGN